MDTFSVIIDYLEIVGLGLIGALILYFVYRTGHATGYDAGVRSDARNFYKKDDRP